MVCLCRFYANWYTFVDHKNTEQNPQMDLMGLSIMEMFSKEIVVNYIRGSFTVLYFIFGCLPLLSPASHFDMLCKYIKYIS